MGLVQKHEGEYRQWHHAWGPVVWPRETEDWGNIVQPAVGGLDPDHALVKHQVFDYLHNSQKAAIFLYNIFFVVHLIF